MVNDLSGGNYADYDVKPLYNVLSGFFGYYTMETSPLMLFLYAKVCIYNRFYGLSVNHVIHRFYI